MHHILCSQLVLLRPQEKELLCTTVWGCSKDKMLRDGNFPLFRESQRDSTASRQQELLRESSGERVSSIHPGMAQVGVSVWGQSLVSSQHLNFSGNTGRKLFVSHPYWEPSIFRVLQKGHFIIKHIA